MIGLIATCDVYTQSGTGLFDTLAHSGLPCRFVPIGQESLADRGLPNQSRKLLFTASYDMPTDAQLVDSDGQRWNTRSDTMLARVSPFGGLHHRSVTVVRATDDD